MTNNSETSTKVHQWTVSDYHRMLTQAFWRKTTGWSCYTGIFLDEPQRPPHTTATKRAYDYLKPLLWGRRAVSSPYHLKFTFGPGADICCGSYRRT